MKTMNANLQTKSSRAASRPKRRRRKLYGILAALLLVILIAAQILPLGAEQLTVTVESGSREILTPVTALVARNEQVLNSTARGQVNRLAAEGRRVAAGAPLVRIDGPGGQVQSIASPRGGVVCYHLDGLEDLLRPEIVKELDGLTAEKLSLKTSELPVMAEPGSPVVKLIDNLAAGGLVLLYEGQAPAETARVYLNDSTALSGPATALSADLLYLELSAPLPQELVHQRQIEVNLVTGTLKGLWLPAQAITERRGRKGVNLVTPGGVTWQEIGITGEAGDWIRVEELEEGQKVVVSRQEYDPGSEN